MSEKRIRVIFDPFSPDEFDELVCSNLAAANRARFYAGAGQDHLCFVTFDHATGEHGDCSDLHRRIS